MNNELNSITPEEPKRPEADTTEQEILEQDTPVAEPDAETADTPEVDPITPEQENTESITAEATVTEGGIEVTPDTAPTDAAPEAAVSPLTDGELPPDEPEESTVSLPEDPSEDGTLIFGVPEQEDLSHALLDNPIVGEEIGADENAILHAGLTHPSAAEIDRIIDDSKSISGSGTQHPFIDPEVQDVFGENAQGLSDVFDDAPTDAADNKASDENGYTSQAEETEKKDKEVQKRRPAMKKGYGLLGIPHIIATAIWLAIIALIGISLGRMIWVCAAEVLAFGKPDHEYTITVTDSDNIDTIAAKLKSAGVIKYPELFKLYADLTDAQEDISAGTFTLNSKFDYHALVIAMSYHSPAREYIELLIPEGYTCAQIFALLEESGVCTVAELEEYAANGEIKDRWFLEGIQRGDKYCLEGYLFPDTYQFYTNDEPGRVLGKFLDNFDARFTDLMKNKLDPLNERLAAILADRGYDEETIASRKITIREVVIIASMIERETANDAESYQISSVIYNRLTNPKNYPYLNIDATLIYALGGNIDPETGKTKPLTSEDLKMEHPYNTYTVKGLIPGPISNPGRNSLNAALDPMETNYYFYVYNPNTSTHLFAKDAKEHEKNVNYVRSLDKED